MLGVTYRCQLRCNHCGIIENCRENGELNVDAIKSLVDQVERLFALNLIGGEPTLREDIMEIVSYGSKKALVVTLDTNGLRITKEYAQKLKDSGLKILFISLDSSTPEIHDSNRNLKGCFDKALDAMKNALEANLQCYFSYTVTNEGLENGDFEKVIELAKKIDAHGVRYLTPFPSGAWLHKPEVILTERNAKKLYQINKREFPYAFREFHTQSQENRICLAIRTIGYYYVSPYGDLQPCIVVPFTFGNIREKPLKEILNRMWESPIYDIACKNTNCVMADQNFRKTYINELPLDTKFPIIK